MCESTDVGSNPTSASMREFIHFSEDDKERLSNLLLPEVMRLTGHWPAQMELAEAGEVVNDSLYVNCKVVLPFWPLKKVMIQLRAPEA